MADRYILEDIFSLRLIAPPGTMPVPLVMPEPMKLARPQASTRAAEAWRDRLVDREPELLARLGVDWPQHGQRHIRCPFPEHEDRRPSWRWDTEHRAWFCTCGGGDFVSAVMRLRASGFKDSVRWIEQELGLCRRSTVTKCAHR